MDSKNSQRFSRFLLLLVHGLDLIIDVLSDGDGFVDGKEPSGK